MAKQIFFYIFDETMKKEGIYGSRRSFVNIHRQRFFSQSNYCVDGILIGVRQFSKFIHRHL